MHIQIPKSPFKIAFSILTIGLFLSLSSNSALAAEKEEEENKEKVVPGVIASFGQAKGAKSVDVSSTGEVGGGANSPISASLRRGDGENCQAVVTNNSKKNGYSIRFSIGGTTAKGGSVSKRSYSARLKPGKSTTKSVKCPKGASMQVVLKSGSKI